MQTPSEPARQILLERYAERRALEICRSATFAQCLKDHGVAPTTTVKSSKGISVIVRGIDIYALRKRLIDLIDLEGREYPLSSLGEHSVGLCEHWLLNEYSIRK